MKNRPLIAFILTLAMLISLVPVGVFAEPEQGGEPQQGEPQVVQGTDYAFYATPEGAAGGAALTSYTITAGANIVYVIGSGNKDKKGLQRLSCPGCAHEHRFRAVA